MHQNHFVEQTRVLEDDGGENVGAVGIAEADRPARRRALLVRAHEVGHRQAPSLEVLEVIDALGLATKEARGAVFGNVAARRDDARPRPDLLAQAEELVFVAARAVKREDERRARLRRLLPKFISLDSHRPAPFNL
jgi:hypothetical protein